MEIIEGTITGIIYRSADGYTVLDIDGNTPTTVVGTLPDLQVGEYMRFFGAFKEHKTYGIQFAATSCESTLPADVNDIEMFLSGGFIKGIGEVISSRIVEKFGEETFRVIEEDWMSLSHVRGVSKKMAEKIHNAFIEYTGSRDSYAKLMGLGLTAKQAVTIFNALGPGAAESVKCNPYLLIPYVRGIDFITADAIAKKIGIEGSAAIRVQSGILHVLKKSLELGYTNVPESRLVSTVSKKLGVGDSDVTASLDELTVIGKVVRKIYTNGEPVVFLKFSYETEHYIAMRLVTMLKAGVNQKISGYEEKIKKQQKKYSLSDEQADALRTVLESPVSIITGGPGTGKTTILKALTNILAISGNTFDLCAPTGRAAKKMSETCGDEAKTIHRLLEFSHEKDDDASTCVFRRNEENPLDCGTLIVDESSMIDVFLFKNLLEALSPGTRLVIVGDANQLPSVGPGAVMEDLIKSGVVPIAVLTHIFRHDGGIADAAHSVLEGRMPDFNADIQFIEDGNVLSVQQKVIDIYEKAHRDEEDVQMLAPIKDTAIGSRELDALLRDRINPENPFKEEYSFGEHVYRVGDRVMQIKNNYSMEWYTEKSEGTGVFNGDIGVIARIAAGCIYVDFDGRIACYEPADFPELSGAYAYTVHKSQGNEFDTVILPMIYSSMPFFSRNLLYTAITRAKKKVIIVGSRKTLEYMISNAQKDKRYTALCQELEAASVFLFH